MENAIVPYISGDEMRAVDQGMVSICGISMVQMMENAGRLLAVLAVQEFLAADREGSVVVLAVHGAGDYVERHDSRRLARSTAWSRRT